MRGEIESFDSNFLLAVALPRSGVHIREKQPLFVVASPPLLSIHCTAIAAQDDTAAVRV